MGCEDVDTQDGNPKCTGTEYKWQERECDAGGHRCAACYCDDGKDEGDDEKQVERNGQWSCVKNRLPIGWQRMDLSIRFHPGILPHGYGGQRYEECGMETRIHRGELDFAFYQRVSCKAVILASRSLDFAVMETAASRFLSHSICSLFTLANWAGGSIVRTAR